MATFLTHLCIKHNKKSLIFLAVPLGFAIDFAIMYPLFKAIIQ